MAAAEHLGVCERHRRRMATDEEYRKAALYVSPNSPVVTAKTKPGPAKPQPPASNRTPEGGGVPPSSHF